MDMQTSLSRYALYKEIGKGTYGIVYLAKDIEENSYVALKRIQFKESKEGILPTIIREVGNLKRMNHPNVVAIKDFFIEDNSCYISFEYLECDLKRFIDTLTIPLSETNVKWYLYQLINGLSYCHSNLIIHRDLKPHNLLLNESELKIGDFGLSRFNSFPDEPVTPTVQTLWYRAPELLLGGSYCEKIDLWSVGCIFAELVTGVPIFHGTNQLDQVWTIFKTLGSPDESSYVNLQNLIGFHPFPKWAPVSFKELFPMLSEDGVDLMSKLLAIDPSKRINAHQALRHSYFREFRYVNINKN